MAKVLQDADSTTADSLRDVLEALPAHYKKFGHESLMKQLRYLITGKLFEEIPEDDISSFVSSATSRSSSIPEDIVLIEDDDDGMVALDAAEAVLHRFVASQLTAEELERVIEHFHRHLDDLKKQWFDGTLTEDL